MQKPTGKEPSKRVCWEYNAMQRFFGPPADLGPSIKLAQELSPACLRGGVFSKNQPRKSSGSGGESGLGTPAYLSACL